MNRDARLSRVIAASVAIAMGAATVPAWAQGTAPGTPVAAAPKPAELFASGEKKFKAADYAGALTDFEASNAAAAGPEKVRYIGQCHDNLGHFAAAATAYQAFLASPPKGPDAQKQVDETTKRLEAIKAMPGKLTVTSTPAGARLVVDDKPYDKPTPTELELTPGKHKIVVSADKLLPAEREVEVAFASKGELAVQLQDATVPPPPPPPPPEPVSKLPAYITGGIAIVAAGIGTGFGIKALTRQDDFKANPTPKIADSGENNALISDMAFGVAITFGVTSAVLFFSDTATDAKTGKSGTSVAKKSGPSITPTPIVTKNGGGAGALVRF